MTAYQALEVHICSLAHTHTHTHTEVNFPLSGQTSVSIMKRSFFALVSCRGLAWVAVFPDSAACCPFQNIMMISVSWRDAHRRDLELSLAEEHLSEHLPSF